MRRALPLPLQFQCFPGRMNGQLRLAHGVAFLRRPPSRKVGADTAKAGGILALRSRYAAPSSTAVASGAARPIIDVADELYGGDDAMFGQTRRPLPPPAPAAPTAGEGDAMWGGVKAAAPEGRARGAVDAAERVEDEEEAVAPWDIDEAADGDEALPAADAPARLKGLDGSAAALSSSVSCEQPPADVVPHQLDSDATPSLLGTFFAPPVMRPSGEEGSALPHGIVSFVDAKSDEARAIEAQQEALMVRGQYNKVKFPAIAREKAPPSASTLTLNVVERPFKLAIAPSVTTPDLLSHADAIAAEVVPRVPAPGYLVDLAKGFADRKLRHEGVLKASLWRTFKWDYLHEGRARAAMETRPHGDGGMRGGQSSPSPAAIVPVESAFNTTALANLPAPLLHDLTASSAAMFELMTEQSLTHDDQLMFVAVSRLVECAPFMLPKDLGAALRGLQLYNKTYLTLADVLLREANHNTRELFVDSLGKVSVVEEMGPQANVLDFLLDKLERQVVRTAALLTAEDVLRIMEGLSHTGVRDPTVIRTLARATTRLVFTPYQAGKLLQHTATVHERLVSLLVQRAGGPHAFEELRARSPDIVREFQQSCGANEGQGGAVVPVGDAGEGGAMLSSIYSSSDGGADGGNGIAGLDIEGTLTLCAPLFMEAAKKINKTSLVALSRDNPMLIIELRRMCETNALVTTHVPELWDVIRHVHIPQHVLRAGVRRTEFGADRLPAALDVQGTDFKLKPIAGRSVDRRKGVPNAFRDWERRNPWYDDPTKTRAERMDFGTQARRQYMGVRRIKKDGLLKHEAKRTRGLRKIPKKSHSKGNYKPHDGGVSYER